MFNESPVEFVQSFKYLSLAFDCKLNFNMHLVELHSKLLRYCGLAFRLKSKLNGIFKLPYHIIMPNFIPPYLTTLWRGVVSSCQPIREAVRAPYKGALYKLIFSISRKS